MIQSATIQITAEILSLVAGIDEFKGAWRALGTLAPDRLSALLRVAAIESILPSGLQTPPAREVPAEYLLRIWHARHLPRTRFGSVIFSRIIS